MKVIIEGLKERLEEVAARRTAEDARHADAIREIEQDEEVIKGMIAIEERRSMNGAGPLHSREAPLYPGTANQVETWILNLLALAARDDQAVDHSDIKQYLVKKGLGSVDDPNFGRSVQGTLLSLRARGLVEHVGTGSWAIGKEARSAIENSTAERAETLRRT